MLTHFTYKLLQPTKLFFAALLVFLVVGVESVSGANYFSVANGDWNTSATWSNTDQGTPLITGYPIAGDIVTITRGFTVTVSVADAACLSLQLGKTGGNAAGAGALVFANSGNPNLTVSGAVNTGGTSNNNGSTGTITFTNVSSMNAGSLKIGGSNGGNTGTITMTAGGTFTISGAITIGADAGTWTSGAGTVIMNATNTLPATVVTQFNNLTCSGGNTTTGRDIIINGNLSVGDGDTFTAAGFGLTVTGTTTVGGGASGSLVISSATGIKSFRSLVTIANGATWNNSGNSAVEFRGGITTTPTFTGGLGTHTFSTNGQALTGTFSIPNVTVNAITLINNNTLTVATALTGSTGTLTNIGTLNIGGSCSIGTTSGGLSNSGTVAISGTGNITTLLAGFTNTGTINLGGSGTIAGITNNANGIVNLTNSGTITSFNNATSSSTLNISDLTVPTFTTLTTSVAGNTVNYSGSGTQTVKANTYSNLTLSGTSAKTTTGVTVNGILSMEGNGVTVSALPTYGASATLQYKGSATQTTGTEFPTTFSGTGGVIIDNSGGSVILNGAKILNTNVPLTINSGRTLATNNYQLTLGGNFINSGGTFTTGSSAIDITGTATQSISGFTTTGAVTMTKTSGIATLQGNVNAGTLTLNGNGGSLNLGSGSAHTFIGANLFINAGTLVLGATEALSNTQNIAFGGGTISTGITAGYNETLGTINVSANSTIQLGTGSHSLIFDACIYENWTNGAILTITGWTGGYNGTSGTAGKVFVGTNSNGLTAAQLSQTIFFNGTNYYTATMLSTGEVVPTSTVVTLSLSYLSPNTFAQNVSITPLTPTINFKPISYSVSPPLPAGLSLNTSTGIISGTPTTNQGALTYTVTATDGINNKTFGISISIVAGFNRYSVASGDWNSTATWAQTSGGSPGQSVPTAGDAVFIERGYTVTVTAAAAAASINFTNATANNTALTISDANTLTVSGPITMLVSGTDNRFRTINVNAGTLIAGSLTMNATTLTRYNDINITTGSATFGNVTTLGASSRFVFTGAGTLNFNGTTTWTEVPTLTTVAGSTVNYSNYGVQTVLGTTYNGNLTLSGSGAKTTTGITVNGILSMEGTATVTALPTYGTDATLQYKGNAAQIAGLEFPATFTPSGGVIINNANGVSVTGAKTVGSGLIGTLSLINGILTTNGNLITINNTAPTGIIGGSAVSYINGTLLRALPTNLTTGFTYNFPVGVGASYLPFSLVNATTSGTATAQVQAFNSNPGGSVDGTLNSKSSTEYWSLITTGSYTNSSVSIGRQTPIISNDVIAGSNLSNGTYTSLAGSSSIYSVSTSNPIGATYRFFTLAAGKTPKITTSTDNLTGFYYIYDFGPSGEQTFTVNGTSLAANITITPSANIEISTASGIGFQSTPLVVSYTNNTIVYVRLKVGLTVGTYNSEGITLTSGVTTKTIACRGNVLSSSLAVTAGGGLSCSTGNIELTSSKSNVYWTGPNDFYSTDQNPIISSPTPADYGIYTVTSSILSGVNLVTNGDFEAGNSGFSSSYGYSTNLAAGGEGGGEGLYWVGISPSTVHSGFAACVDHTTTGVGNQMVINGSINPSTILWSQTVNVNQGTDYQFSYWLQSVVGSSASELQLYVNGIPAGPSKIATLTECDWTEYKYNWNSGTNTTAFLSIINKNTDPGGNDFALDDVAFEAVLQITSSVNVTNNNTTASVIISASATNVRAGTNVTFTATPTNGGITPTYKWKVNGIEIVGAVSEVYSYVPIDGDVVECEMTSSNSCSLPKPAISNTISLIVTVRTNYWIGTTSTDWNDVTNWTGGFVPASGNDVEFATEANNNNFPAVKDLYLDFNRIIGSLINLTPKSLVIPTNKGLIVNDLITTDENPDRIIIKSGVSAVNGSLIFPNASNVFATVEMYSQADKYAPGVYDPTTLKTYYYNWQFFGIPIESVVAQPTFDGSYVREYQENKQGQFTKWNQLNNSSVLTPFKGYEITQDNPTTIYFKGKLVNANKTADLTMSSDPLVFDKGHNLLANSYTAAIKVSEIVFGANTEESVYLYNTGSFAIWSTTGGSSANSESPGQYLSIPKDASGFPGLPEEIPSMGAFLVKALSVAGGQVTINYNTTIIRNINPQRAPTNSNTDKVGCVIDLKGEKTADRMWIISNSNSTRGFDNGWDGYKITDIALNPQLFAMEKEGNFQVNSVPDINDTDLGFKAGIDSEYTLTFTHHNMEKQYPGLFLVDMLENKITDITASGSTYSFVATNTAEPVKRFKIITRQYEKNASDNDSEIKMFSSQGIVFVQNYSNVDGECALYDISGRYLMKVPFGANTVTMVSNKLKPGAYVARSVTSLEKVSKRLIVR